MIEATGVLQVGSKATISAEEIIVQACLLGQRFAISVVNVGQCRQNGIEPIIRLVCRARAVTKAVI